MHQCTGEIEGDPLESCLAETLAAFIESGDTSDAAFDSHARQLFAYQYERNAPYRAYCTARNVSPDRISHWTEIPPAPTLAFKAYPLTCTPPGKAARIFRSSGTTSHTASRHFLSPAALALYERSLRSGFSRFVPLGPEPRPIWALLPSPAMAPESSLSYMVDSLMRERPHADHRFFWTECGLDVAALDQALSTARTPLLLFGTAFAWVQFFEACDHCYTVPPGTRLIETGGFKGRTRTLSRQELYAFFVARLGLSEDDCLAEYGMSELCSQFYDDVLLASRQSTPTCRRKQGPPWTRTRVLDPGTGEECPPGTPGLLCHFDCANLNSVVAVLTEDVGRDLGGGFELLGRLPGAPPRGCSLTAEEWQPRD